MVSLNGFVKIHRKFRNWEWYTDTNTKAVFLELLLTANFKDTKFKGYDVPRGSTVTSIPSLANDLNLSERNVRTALKHLKATGEVTVKTTSKFSIITMKNYNMYQDDDRQNASQMTLKCQSSDSQMTGKRQHRKNKRIEEGNKERNNPPFGEKSELEELARENGFESYEEMIRAARE